MREYSNDKDIIPIADSFCRILRKEFRGRLLIWKAMIYKFISDSNNLDPLLDINFKDCRLDLHNSFDCRRIVIDSDTVEVFFSKSDSDTHINEKELMVGFAGVRKVEVNDASLLHFTAPLTVVNFARGELLPENEFYGVNGVKYFFIEFDNDLFIDVFCTEAIVILW
jgi:hypothetical protein